MLWSLSNWHRRYDRCICVCACVSICGYTLSILHIMGISSCVGHTAYELVSVVPSFKSLSPRICWNLYWLPLQDKCKSHSLIFAIYQDAAAHFRQGKISLTRIQTALHLNSIFIVRRSLSSERREKHLPLQGKEREGKRETNTESSWAALKEAVGKEKVQRNK